MHTHIAEAATPNFDRTNASHALAPTADAHRKRAPTIEAPQLKTTITTLPTPLAIPGVVRSCSADNSRTSSRRARKGLEPSRQPRYHSSLRTLRRHSPRPTPSHDPCMSAPGLRSAAQRSTPQLVTPQTHALASDACIDASGSRRTCRTRRGASHHRASTVAPCKYSGECERIARRSSRERVPSCSGRVLGSLPASLTANRLSNQPASKLRAGAWQPTG